MLFRRPLLPLCTLTLVLVLLAGAGWLTFATPSEKPLSIKLLKVSLVTPISSSPSARPGRSYEEVEYEIQNTSRLAVEVGGMQLRDGARATHTLALDYKCHTRCQLDPGESCRRSMRIHASVGKGASTLAAPMNFAYRWQTKPPSLKTQIRGWYNRLHEMLPLRLRSHIPQAKMFHPAEVTDVAPLPATPVASAP